MYSTIQPPFMRLSLAGSGSVQRSSRSPSSDFISSRFESEADLPMSVPALRELIGVVQCHSEKMRNPPRFNKLTVNVLFSLLPRRFR